MLSKPETEAAVGKRTFDELCPISKRQPGADAHMHSVGRRPEQERAHTQPQRPWPAARQLPSLHSPLLFVPGCPPAELASDLARGPASTPCLAACCVSSLSSPFLPSSTASTPLLLSRAGGRTYAGRTRDLGDTLGCTRATPLLAIQRTQASNSRSLQRTRTRLLSQSHSPRTSSEYSSSHRPTWRTWRLGGGTNARAPGRTMPCHALGT